MSLTADRSPWASAVFLGVGYRTRFLHCMVVAFSPVYQENYMKYIVLALIYIFLLSGCSPKVGSDEWCASLKEKHKADWTVRETKDFAKNCIF